LASSSGEVLLDPLTGELKAAPNPAKWDPPPFPAYAGIDRLDRANKILWPARSLGALKLYLAESGPQRDARHLDAIAINGASGQVIWKVWLGTRHIARMRM
jgi:hypothetical protein